MLDGVKLVVLGTRTRAGRVISTLATMIDTIAIVTAFWLNHHFIADNGWVSCALFILSVYTLFGFVMKTSPGTKWMNEAQALAYLQARHDRAKKDSIWSENQ